MPDAVNAVLRWCLLHSNHRGYEHDYLALLACSPPEMRFYTRCSLSVLVEVMHTAGTCSTIERCHILATSTV